jgi:hypothetical protein
MSKLSLELRWFFRGLVPGEMQTWFSRKLPADRPQKEKVRQDLYFIVRDREDLGLKLSRGRLELKCRQESQPFSLSEPRMSGVQETWIKQEWRYAKEFADNLEVAFGKPKLQGWRVEVQKNRSMRKYQVDATGKVSDLPIDQPAERLFKVELTSLIKHDRPWWTLGIEISGEPPNLHEIFAIAVKNLLDGHPELDLNTDRSYGYPHWLMHSG